MSRTRLIIVAALAASLAACAGQSTATPNSPAAPAASAPNSSAPTSAPSSSAPASTAPATSAPVTTTSPTPTTTRITRPPVTSAPPAPPGAQLTLTGTVEAGVERGCLILKDTASGRQFNLTAGDKNVVKAGAKVTVVGVIRRDMMSYCQQGAIFQVLRATSATGG